MTYNELLLKANELIVNYYKKYKREPNAILMNEEVFTALKVYTAGYYAIERPKETETYQFFGLKVIPVKHGEMEVVELL